MFSAGWTIEQAHNPKVAGSFRFSQDSASASTFPARTIQLPNQILNNLPKSLLMCSEEYGQIGFERSDFVRN